MSSYLSCLFDLFSRSCSLRRSPAAVVTKTSSRTSTVVVHSGEHRFKVFRHSRIKGSNTRLTSRTFRVGGHEWAIDYYPNGDCSVVDSQFSSVYLTLVSTNESEVTTSASFCLQDVASPAPPGTGEKTKKSLAIKFSPSKTRNGKSFGIREFVSKADLAASGCLENDCLVIKCSMVIQDCVDDDDILCGFMRESKQSIINIDDMDPDIFELLLYYMYNDYLPDFMDGPTEEAKNTVQHLLVAADRYAVQRLKQIRESKLSKALDVDTVGFILALAEQYHCHRLKAHGLKYIKMNKEKLGTIEKTEGFVQLKHNHPRLAGDILAMAQQCE
ncbi:unnamed protein product [Alopecurus aequalis]